MANKTNTTIHKTIYKTIYKTISTTIRVLFLSIQIVLLGLAVWAYLDLREIDNTMPADLEQQIEQLVSQTDTHLPPEIRERFAREAYSKRYTPPSETDLWLDALATRIQLLRDAWAGEDMRLRGRWHYCPNVGGRLAALLLHIDKPYAEDNPPWYDPISGQKRTRIPPEARTETRTDKHTQKTTRRLIPHQQLLRIRRVQQRLEQRFDRDTIFAFYLAKSRLYPSYLDP